MSWSRKHSLAAGLFYLLTFVSIPTLSLYVQVHTPNYIAGPGPDTAVLWGAVLELIVGLAGIGTAVALFPVVKEAERKLGVGFRHHAHPGSRWSLRWRRVLLSIVTLRRAGVGADGLITGQVLVAMYDRLFLVSGSFMPAMTGCCSAS